jgi:hypothetical protein
MSKVEKQEELDIDKNQLAVLRKQTDILERYEGKIQSLLQDRLDDNITEEDWGDRQEDLRKSFLREFNEVNAEIDNSTQEIHFRNVLYKATLDQIKRCFGYYNALTDLDSKIKQYNMELNDQVLENDPKSQLSLIMKLEHVKLTATMAEALGLPVKWSNKIVEHTIDKLFASHKK